MVLSVASSIATSALRAAQVGMSVTSANIASADVDGYTAKTVTLTSTVAGGQGTGVSAAAIAGGVGYWRGGKHAATAAELAMAEHLAADRKAESDHKDKVRQLEQALATAQAGVSEAYEKGKKDAEATATAVIADLRAGNLRLQQRWTGCEAQRLSDAAALAGELDAAARDREESAG